MRRCVKSLLALVLTMALIVSVFPPIALAAEETEPLRIFTIGNSHSLDSTWLLSEVFRAQAPDREVILGAMYYSGCTMSSHVSYATNNTPAYSYYKDVDGVWTSTKECTLATALEDEPWDIVVMQEMNIQVAQEKSFKNTNIQKLMHWVKRIWICIGIIPISPISAE